MIISCVYIKTKMCWKVLFQPAIPQTWRSERRRTAERGGSHLQQGGRLSEIDTIQGRQRALLLEYKSLSGSGCSCSCRWSNLHSYSSCLPSGLQTGRSDSEKWETKFLTLRLCEMDASMQMVCIVTVVPSGHIWKGQRQTNSKDWGTRTN